MSNGLEEYLISRNEKVLLEKVRPDPKNVRDKYFKGGLIVLADSIARSGQLQPALMELSNDGCYDLVAGNRRYYASVVACESGWIDRNWMLGKIIRPLPADLRLRLQCAENEYKAPVPKDNLANVFWNRYKPTAIQNIDGLSEIEIEAIHSAKHFWELPLKIQRGFSIDDYSAVMGFGKKSVRNAFVFQRLHGDIKRQVSENKLSYSSMCELARIKDKKEQKMLLANLKREKKITRFYVGKNVDRYFDNARKDEESGTFMRAEEVCFGRSQNMKDLSSYVGDADKTVRIFNSVGEIIPGVKDIIASGNIITNAYSALEQIHKKLLENTKYKSRWEFVPRSSSLEEFVLSNVSGTKRGGNVMDYVCSKIITVESITPNSLNPRGGKATFNKDAINQLARSIEEDGLIHDVLVMETTNPNEYISLEGHRRTLALGKNRTKEVGALILPTLTEQQQVMVMCDSDLFESISYGARAQSIARQYVLDNEAVNGSLSVDDFVKVHKSEWSGKIIRDSIAYDSLSDKVKKIHEFGLMPYGTAVEIAKIKDIGVQENFAANTVIMGQSRHDLKNTLKEENSEEGLLFDRTDFDKMREQGVLRKLENTLRDNLGGVVVRVKKVLEKDDVSEFLSDDIFVGKFQRLMKTLGGVV